MLELLAANGPVDVLSGGGSWVGAGLLGMVLAWLLLRHLPAKDQQIKDFVAHKDQQIKDLNEHYESRLALVVTSYRQESREAKDEFKLALNTILKHCESEMTKAVDTFRAEVGRSHRSPPS